MGNFMSANTEIEGVIEKRNQCLTKIANIVAQSCVERGRAGKVNKNMSNDIINLLKDLSKDEQVIVLSEALSVVSNQLADGSSNNRRSSGSGYFSNRGY